MPNNDEQGTLKNQNLPDTWKPPSWLEPAFIYMALSVAIVATLGLLLWFFVTFVAPFSIYPRERGEFALGNGQTLRVQYPNMLRAGDPTAHIELILSGVSKSTEPVEFTVEIPPGITVVEPAAQAQSKTLQLAATTLGSDTEAALISIGVVNSWSVDTAAWQPVKVKSVFLSEPILIPVGVETVFPSYMRGIVNNTLNEKSALILLVTGFLSGAGTLVMQYVSKQQDRSREDREKRETQFREQWKEYPIDALDSFSRLERDEANDSEFFIKKPVVETFGWEHKLQQMILESLKSRDHYFDAKRAADVLHAVCATFDPGGQNKEYRHSRSFKTFCELVCEDDRKTQPLTAEQAQCLLDVSRRWHELKPLAANLIHDFAVRPENLPVLAEKFALEESAPESERARQLLRDANIYDTIHNHVTELDGIVKTSPADDVNRYHAAAKKINDLLIQDVHWRKTEWGRERKLSDKTLRWLFACLGEKTVDTEFSLGAELAELEDRKKHSALELPVFGRIKDSDAVIVFGAEGTGKTAAALWLLDQYQDQASAGIFPVYAPYEAAVELKDWVVGTIARALINFIADNPRKFMISPESRRTAMGRLMLWHAHSLDALRLNLYSSTSEHNNTADVEQVMEYLKRLKLPKAQHKLTKDEMLSSLYLAYPDGFDQIWFLWDVPASSPQEDVVARLKEMTSLAAPLSRQNVIVKIFAPLTSKDAVKNLGGIYHAGDLTWNNDQLMDLLSKKMNDKFKNLWDISLRDAISGLLVQRAEDTPRELVRLLLRLMDRVDDRLSQKEEPLQDGDTLNQNDFDQWLPALAGKK